MAQADDTCNDCGNDDPEYKCSDRHHGYYEYQNCGNDITVDYYA
jgi:hypothetical protein